MKRILFPLTVAALLAFVGCGTRSNADIPPSSDGLFSVAKGRQVRFAPGNLEYDSVSGYRFAEHQYDYGGHFGWGTGSNPMLASTNNEDYPTFDDWGNPIDGGWRTLSKAEWRYVVFDRTHASAKRGAATVCGVHGMILLPDNWNGGTFHAGFNSWSTNVYDASSWSAMEDTGAVFLPADGGRYGADGLYGGYWSSTPNDEDLAYDMSFDGDDVYDHSGSRGYGLSVRLVLDY